MSRRDYANRIVQQLCADLGLPPSELESDGRLSLHFDDILITIAHREQPLEMLSLLIDLGELPPGDTVAAEYLLTLNFNSWLRNGTTLGLDAAGRRILGQNAIPVSTLDVAGLREVLEAMLTVAQGARQALQQPELSYPAAGADTSRSSPPADTFARPV